MSVLEEKRIGDYLIKIRNDENGDNPRSWDNLGRMVCLHRRYNLGDKHSYRSGDHNGWGEMEKAIIKNENVGVILPLYLYDHGGITISTEPFSCPWDSGRIGFIFISKKKILEEYGGKIVTKKLKDKVTKYLKSEVETYDKFLTGDVYRYDIYKIETCDKGCEHKEFKDGCGGFYEQEEAMSEAEGIVGAYEEKELVV